jgi:enamine deaminase RidA (YjgF/YER057c/UK114 family)
MNKIVMSINERIKELNIVLPQPKEPVGAYVAYKIVGNLLFVSGQISIDEKGVLIKGKLGEDLTVEDGYKAAQRCALAIISHAKSACKNDLTKIKSCVKLTGYVNSANNFTEQPKVINGASDLITLIFEEKGKHARAAVSVNGLPLGVAVEVDAIFEII